MKLRNGRIINPAIDLKENTIASYKENIKIKAAMLYKEDGNDAMVSYLNSVVGDIFQQEEASSLKKEIVNMYMPDRTYQLSRS